MALEGMCEPHRWQDNDAEREQLNVVIQYLIWLDLFGQRSCPEKHVVTNFAVIKTYHRTCMHWHKEKGKRKGSNLCHKVI